MTTFGMAPPSAIARNQALGQMLMQQGLVSQPIQHPLQGLSRVAQMAMGAFLTNRADRQDQERREAANQALMELLGPQAAPQGGTTASPTGPAGPDISALLQFAGQFPEMAGTVNPLIAARLQGPKTFTGVAAPGSQVFQGGELVASVPATERPPKLIEVADPSSPTGTRFVPVSEAVGQPGRPRQEFRVETVTDPNTGETRTIMVRGTPGGTEAAESVSKPTRSKLEQSITTATTQLDRLSQIRENLDTRFLNLPEQFKQGGRALMERLGVELSPEARKDLQAYTRFASSTRRNMNRILNELSGAAISPAEAKRLMAELPTTNDSPTQFMAKVADAERAIQASIERNQGLLDRGVAALEFDREGNITNAQPLEDFMAIPEARGAVEAGMAGAASDMSNEQLISADTSRMSLEELEAWNAEMDRRGL